MPNPNDDNSGDAHATEASPIALIPAFNPEPNLVPIVRELAKAGTFGHIVVVNDGSNESTADTFRACEAIGHVTVLEHYVNLGKGAALKTGLNYVGVHHPDAIGVVTLDADGQHLTRDVLKVAETLRDNRETLVLGSREFGSDVPFRSRFGNVTTRYVLRFFGGLSLRDTQTGLRGIPRSLFGELLNLRTHGYDFELDMLLLAKRHRLAIEQVPIETVYLDENKSSHFNPLVDSLKIYMVFIRFNFSSLLAVLIDYSMFSLLFALGQTIVVSQFGARVVAGTVNYLVNRQFVFKSDRQHRVAALLYVTVLIVFTFITYGLILFFTKKLGLSVLTAKIVAELLLYFASFAVQREIIFARRGASDGG